MEFFNVAVLVKNKYGVLYRVTSMFRRRQFNIVSLNVSETETPEFSRITVKAEGDVSEKQQLINQLYKLPDVKSIKELAEDASLSEVLLIKIQNDPAYRGEVLDAASAFGAKPVDYNHDAIVLQLTETSRKIDDFISFLQAYNIMEICRSGVVSLERGESVLRVNSYL